MSVTLVTTTLILVLTTSKAANVGSNQTSHSTSNANTGNRTTGISIGNRTTGISIGNRTTGINISSAGSSGTNKNLPPYYALAFVMKL